MSLGQLQIAATCRCPYNLMRPQWRLFRRRNPVSEFEKAFSYPTLEPLIGDRINVGQIESQWDELLRLATSIRQGTVTASLVLRKLASYPRQNGLAWGCANSAASTARCSCSNGYRARSSAAVSRSA
jgi:TnpA family transposase